MVLTNIITSFFSFILFSRYKGISKTTIFFFSFFFKNKFSFFLTKGWTIKPIFLRSDILFLITSDNSFFLTGNDLINLGNFFFKIRKHLNYYFYTLLNLIIEIKILLLYFKHNLTINSLK